MNPLEAKKRALVAESEVLRETLKLELHNLQLYALRTRQKFKSFSRPNPLLMFAAPLLGSLLRKRRSSWIRKAAMAFLSWQLTNRLKPFLAGFFAPPQGGATSWRGQSIEGLKH